MNKYFNLCGLTFVIVILIPNIVFSITCKDGFVNHYQNKLVETLEQIGRFGCFINICRSPMAEFVLKDMVAKRGLAEQFEIASAATSTEEIWNGVGNPVYPPAKAELAKHGLSCEGKRAVQLKASDYDYYDYLIGMDMENISNIERMTGHKAGDKIHLLLEFNHESKSVRDPQYYDCYDETYRDVVTGCTAFLAYLKEHNKI